VQQQHPVVGVDEQDPRPCEPAGAWTAPGSGSSGDHVHSHPAWPGQRQGLAGLLVGYPVTSSARWVSELIRCSGANGGNGNGSRWRRESGTADQS
jgi:hypothetical protein